MKRRYPTIPILLAAIFGLAALGGNAEAADSRGVVAAKAYAKQFGFKTKTLKVGPANRQVQRLFVPVTPESFGAFQEAFSAKHGFASVRYVKNNDHTALALKPGDCYFWARNTAKDKSYDYVKAYFSPSGGGSLIALDLKGAPLKHLTQWLGDGKNADKWRNEHCMRWLPNAEVGPGKLLFHHLGITRANGGDAQASKLVRAANNKVPVVGIRVQTGQAFNGLSDPALLGPTPGGGVEDSIR